MALLLHVLHNPGTTYAEKEIPGFVTLFVSALVPKDIKTIIRNTKSHKYLVGNFVSNNETDNLQNGKVSILIPFEELKNHFDVSEKVVIFKCHIKASVLMRHSIGDTLHLDININLGETVYGYSEALADIKERAALHSVYIKI